MSIKITTLDKLSVLESLYRRGYQSDVIDMTIDKVIALERERAQRELMEFAAHLRDFERQYKMESADFYRRFQQGELGDAADFFEWSALYTMHQSTLERLESLSWEQT